MDHNRLWLGDEDAPALQQLKRQVQPVALSILVHVTQDVGDLQGAALGVGQNAALLGGFAEDVDAQAPDGAGHPVAIDIEGGARRCLDRAAQIHLHAIDHGDEVGLLQIKLRHRRQKRFGDGVFGLIDEQLVDLAAPGHETDPAIFHGHAVVIGNIVHLAAKGVDGENGVASLFRQKTHGPIERG